MDPSASTSANSSTNQAFIQTNNDDINELQQLQGITVWGKQQEVLEQQALYELKTFGQKSDQKEDGQLSEDETPKTTTGGVTLDINLYIKNQEELKKRQVYKRTLQVSEKSKNSADEISRQQRIQLKKKRKRRASHGNVGGGRAKVVKVEEKLNVKVNNKINDGVNENGKFEVNQDGKVEGNEDGMVGGSTTDGNLNNNLVEDDKSGSEYVPSEQDSDYDPSQNEVSEKPQHVRTKQKRSKLKVDKVVDDGAMKSYKARLNKYYEQLEAENLLKKSLDDDTIDEEMEISPGFKISTKIWNNLYSYQQEGLEWMWSLHQQSTGGLLGDEMGLGKTVQVIAFLYAVNYSRAVSKAGRYTGLGPSIIVCPSTVLHQWVKHFHEWTPEFRVAILHQSGSYTGNKTHLIREINKNKAILLTTYQGLLKYRGVITELAWHYIILDEGHKIRNPSAKITETAKLFRTPHRLLVTGSPMQNNLQELWCLFDFIRPGMLGSMQVFMEHFANPIMQGGFANATHMQEALALSMATTLKDMITPYMLRRAKNDVKATIKLPHKSEQVLFCSLTREQNDLYKGYLMSEQVSAILGRGGKNWFAEQHIRAGVLMAITTLRKICNHPDAYLNQFQSAEDETPDDIDRHHYKRSGKMVVVSALLKIWRRQNHRVLLFTQGRAMISIFSDFLTQNNYKYMKMDGTTSVASRQPLIDTFNRDSSYEVFLLTTRVGGLGVNLTGANRVIIYDPDWNPATDTQARERAWRIGQDKDVTIYRLISAGTIEEKIYQRQVWKQLLSNQVLLDPKTQKFFKTSDLHDLFSLQEQTQANPETANIFQNSRISIEQKIREKKDKRKSGTSKTATVTTESATVATESATVTTVTAPKPFTDDQYEKMRKLAASISKNISNQSEKSKNGQAITQTPYQLEISEERQKKLEERAELKKLTPIELRNYNRSKLNQSDLTTNAIDDCETDVSFTKALVISEKTAELYNTAKTHKTKVETAVDGYTTLTKVFAKEKKRRKHVLESDNSGMIDGESIAGLVKREVTKRPKKVESAQNDYVLEKLFSKNSVGSALHHDSVVQGSGSQKNSIRIHSEAQARTDLALQALRKSRVNKWKW